jgi:phenylpyruvate tautomerase PptA (4-oxalocrotonate tautomerase family)
LMDKDGLVELADDINANSLEIPVVLWSPGGGQPEQLLDGRNRLDAAELAGIKTVDFGRLIVPLKVLGPSVDPFAYVISTNIHRRHLTPAQKQDLIAAVLKATPEKSDRQIAKLVRVDHKTIGSLRAEKALTGEISPVERRIGADGKTRKLPARKTTAAKIASEPAAIAADVASIGITGAATTKVLSRDDVGPDSAGERARLIARITELENEVAKLMGEANRRAHPLDVEADKIAARCRKIRAFLDHPEQHRDAIFKLVAEILHAVEPAAKGTRPVSVLSDKLDVTAFGRAMCLRHEGRGDK